MADIHYGVVLQHGRWRLIGHHLSFGAYRSRARAERAARQLADQCGGLAVDLHIQTETGELLPPQTIPAEPNSGTPTTRKGRSA